MNEIPYFKENFDLLPESVKKGLEYPSFYDLWSFEVRERSHDGFFG